MKARLYCKVQVVLQYWLLGAGLCRNTVYCIVTEARQGLYCNTVTVPTIQQGHGRWVRKWALGERACWVCRARARLGVLGAEAAEARRRAARHGRAESWRAHGRASGRAGVGGSDARGARQAQAGARGAAGWAACARLVCAAGPGWVFWCT